MSANTFSIPCLTLLSLLLFQSPASSQPKPNVIIILADDLGYGDVQCYNTLQGKIRTPNIDSLAMMGVRFTDAHSSSAVCSPSRYALLTGRYHWRSRLQKGIVDMWERPLITPDRLTIAGLAESAGYKTAAIGKWHLGWNWPIASDDRGHFTDIGPFEGRSSDGMTNKSAATEDDRAAWKRTFSKPITGGPTELGFDYYFGTDVPNWPPFTYIENDRTLGMPTELLGGEQVNINQASFQGPALKGWDLKQILPEMTQRATNYIRKQAKNKQPFLLYFSLTAPHTPLAVSEHWKNKSRLNNEYADFVMQTDDAVGRLLKALRENGIEENTLVIFTSDNGCGPYIGARQLEEQGHFVSGPLRGYKGDVWEGGHRIPFIVRYPGIAPAGAVNNSLVLQADIMATLADILNHDLPENSGEDSFSFLSLLNGEKKGSRTSAITCRHDGLQAIRMGPWKLLCTTKPELYNLDEDLAEKNNVARSNPKLVRQLLEARKILIVNGRSNTGPNQHNDVEVDIALRAY